MEMKESMRPIRETPHLFHQEQVKNLLNEWLKI